jgi:hypothetical protein
MSEIPEIRGQRQHAVMIDDAQFYGATFGEILENGRVLAQQLSEGSIPAGTQREDWDIVCGVAVYKPYVPLFVTSSPANDHDQKVE